jgi:hypothetical protein
VVDDKIRKFELSQHVQLINSLFPIQHNVINRLKLASAMDHSNDGDTTRHKTLVFVSAMEVARATRTTTPRKALASTTARHLESVKVSTAGGATC